jgi:hypothetical protein
METRTPHKANLPVHNFITPLQIRKWVITIRLKSGTLYHSVHKYPSHLDNLTNCKDNLNVPRCSEQLCRRL